MANPSTARERAAEFARRIKAEYRAGLHEGDTGTHDTGTTDTGTVDNIAGTMRSVDWAAVKAATKESSSEAARAMRSMAAQVDWRKVQPLAAQVSSALIAAVASGQIPIGGPTGTKVVRAIVNDHDLATRVGTVLSRTPEQMPPDFRRVIDVTAVEG